MSISDNKGFLSRLMFASAHRGKNAWLGEIGLSSSVIVGMVNEGKTPTGKTLAALQRCENLSSTWLLDGRGEPFITTHCRDDDECLEIVDVHLTDEPYWKRYILSDGTRYVIVLTQQCSFQHAGSKEIDYTEVEIITGAGPASVKRATAEGGAWGVTVTAEIIDKMERGEIGTYHLVGDKKQLGLLSQATTFSLDEVSQKPLLDTNETAAPYSSDPEEALVSNYRLLDNREQQALITVANSMAAGKHAPVEVKKPRSSTVDVNGRPAGGVLDPDRGKKKRIVKAKKSKTKTDTVAVKE